MDKLRKVSSLDLYLLWKYMSIGLLVIIIVITFSRMLPEIFSPIVSLIGAAVLYTMLYNNRMSGQQRCMIVPYSIFICLIVATFVSIVLNVLFVWNLIKLPQEFIFLSKPYVPSLLLMPLFFVCMTVIYFRRHKLSVCVRCKMRNGDAYERGRTGSILNFETHFQLLNLVVLFGVTTAIIWSYYLGVFIKIGMNARDWYVFVWVVIILFVFDELYFIFRYYNLYLDLKENHEIINQEDLQEMSAKTYLRYYVVCGNNVYVDPHALLPGTPYREVIDTPFFTKRAVNGITLDEVRRTIVGMTGVDNGELRFFFGRRVPGTKNQSVLRYFYFLDGDISDYPHLKAQGEWMDYEIIKKIYSTSPSRLAAMSVADTTRLATIILTEKLYDSRGNRKLRLKHYTPTFNMLDVRKSELDFQDDKWIRISMFNADTPFFRLRRWWRGITGKSAGDRF